MSDALPTLYLPHGGGPCFFMDWTMGPRETWDRMGAWLGGIAATLPAKPRALLVISAHWEQPVATVTSAAQPPLVYDYSGFPPHTYELTWPAAGDPVLAARVRELLSGAGIESGEDTTRGLDHGTFVPLKLTFPDAEVPTVQLSLQQGLDPAAHLAIGRALSPLRREGVFIVGSGMSYHNMRGFGRDSSLAESQRFDAWLAQAVALPQAERADRLTQWQGGPAARECHPREEHLLPLMVCAGAAGPDAGARTFHDRVMGVEVSAHRFG